MDAVSTRAAQPQADSPARPGRPLWKRVLIVSLTLLVTLVVPAVVFRRLLSVPIPRQVRVLAQPQIVQATDHGDLGKVVLWRR